ncbi:MAG: FxLYD domain-containing protein [Acidobacteriota bacterium]
MSGLRKGCSWVIFVSLVVLFGLYGLGRLIETDRGGGEAVELTAAERAEREAEKEALERANRQDLAAARMAMATGDLAAAREAVGQVRQRAPADSAAIALEAEIRRSSAQRREVDAADRERELLAEVEEASLDRRAKIYRELAELRPENRDYGEQAEALRRQARVDRQRQAERGRAELEILDWRWSSAHGYATASGRVRNLTEKPLKNVEAVVTWTTSSGQTVTIRSAIVEFNPIMPGQVSPFRVMAPHNPQMGGASLSFKRMFGGTLRTRKAE